MDCFPSHLDESFERTIRLPTGLTGLEFVARAIRADGEKYTELLLPPPFIKPMMVRMDPFFDGAPLSAQTFCSANLGVSILAFYLPWLRNPDEVICNFWREFVDPVAAAKRGATMADETGGKASSKELVAMVLEHQRLEGLTAAEAHNAELDIIKNGFAERIVEWVVKAVTENPVALRKLYEVLISKRSCNLGDAGEAVDTTGMDPKLLGWLRAAAVATAPPDELYTEAFRILTRFSTLVQKERLLPTKKALREAEGLELHAAARVFRLLGLSKLPQAKG